MEKDEYQIIAIVLIFLLGVALGVYIGYIRWY